MFFVVSVWHFRWKDSFFKYIAKPGKDCCKLKGYQCVLSMQNTIGKLTYCVFVRNSPETLRTWRHSLRIWKGGGDSDQENLHGKIQVHLHMMYLKDSRERTNTGCNNRPGGRLQQGPVQAADGPTCSRSVESTWHCSGGLQERSRKGQWSCSLEFGAVLLVSAQWAYNKDHRCRHPSTKALTDLDQNGASKVLAQANDGLVYKTSRDTQEAITAMQQLDNVSRS